MKLRIKDNSLRIRLSRSEVERLGKEKYVEARTEFGNTVLNYGIRCDDTVDQVVADLVDNRITMRIPPSIAETFITTDAVGFQNEVSLANGKKLFLLFEKDFKCIDGEVLEDQSDNYENPATICK